MIEELPRIKFPEKRINSPRRKAGRREDTLGKLHRREAKDIELAESSKSRLADETDQMILGEKQDGKTKKEIRGSHRGEAKGYRQN